jgi:diaminobutyrate-2-oxoglutarate transaminase
MNKIIQSLRSLGKHFWYLWLGEGITSFGVQMVQFAIGIWIYQQTGSVLSFVGSVTAGVLPALLIMPFAGAIIDRVSRRKIIILCDCVGALMSAIFLVAVITHRLEVHHLYIFAAVSSVLGAFSGPAYQASVNSLISHEHITRASGAMGISQTALGIVTPTLTGFLLASIGLSGLVSLDLLTFLIGAPLVWRAFSNLRHGVPGATGDAPLADRPSPLRNFQRSLEFFTEDLTMLTLLAYSLIQAAMIALASTMVIPLILNQHSPEQLGVALTCGAMGALAGSLLMVVVDAPRRRMKIILSCDAALTLCVILAGFGGSILRYSILEFVASGAASVGGACAYALWMSKIPVARQGSVLVVLSNAAMLTTVVTVILGGILVGVLEARLTTGGGIAAWVSREWLSLGKATAVGMMFVFAGTVGLLATLGGFAYKPLREL